MLNRRLWCREFKSWAVNFGAIKWRVLQFVRFFGQIIRVFFQHFWNHFRTSDTPIDNIFQGFPIWEKTFSETVKSWAKPLGRVMILRVVNSVTIRHTAYFSGCKFSGASPKFHWMSRRWVKIGILVFLIDFEAMPMQKLSFVARFQSYCLRICALPGDGILVKCDGSNN